MQQYHHSGLLAPRALASIHRRARTHIHTHTHTLMESEQHTHSRELTSSSPTQLGERGIYLPCCHLHTLESIPEVGAEKQAHRKG